MSERNYCDEKSFIEYKNSLIQHRNSTNSQFERNVLNEMIADLPKSYAETLNKHNKPHIKSRKKPILKHSIMLAVSSFTALIAAVWASECFEEWESIVSLILFLAAVMVGIISLINLIKSIILRYKSSIRYRERCYKKIDRIHSYLDRGSITQEEFNMLKQDILDKIR